MKLEPFSILASILALSTLFVETILGNLILIVAAIFMSLSYKRFKKDSSYTIKWPLYISAVIVIVTIIIKVVGISIAPFTIRF